MTSIELVRLSSFSIRPVLNRVHVKLLKILFVMQLICTFPSIAGDEPLPDDPLFYRNPEERREAGLGTKVTEWLTVSGLVEMEREQTYLTYGNGDRETDKSIWTKTMQGAADLTFSDSWEMEFVVEAEHEDKTRVFIDEAALSWEGESLGLTIGHFSPAFGEYYSHLVLGPAVEIGEITQLGVELDFELSDSIELAVFAIKSDVKASDKSDLLDYGMALQWQSADESIRIGIGYLSDLAETDERLTEEINAPALNKVDAINAHALFGFSSMEISVEFVGALKSFQNQESHLDKPRTANIEWAFYPSETIQVALRYEYIQELEDMPDKRYAIGVRWIALERLSLAIDYSESDYRAGNYDPVNWDDSEDIIIDDHQVGLMLSIEF